MTRAQILARSRSILEPRLRFEQTWHDIRRRQHMLRRARSGQPAAPPTPRALESCAMATSALLSHSAHARGSRPHYGQLARTSLRTTTGLLPDARSTLERDVRFERGWRDIPLRKHTLRRRGPGSLPRAAHSTRARFTRGRDLPPLASAPGRAREPSRPHATQLARSMERTRTHPQPSRSRSTPERDARRTGLA